MSNVKLEEQLSSLFRGNAVGAAISDLYQKLVADCQSNSQTILAEYLISQFAEDVAREFYQKGNAPEQDLPFDLEPPADQPEDESPESPAIEPPEESDVPGDETEDEESIVEGPGDDEEDDFN